MLNPRRKYKEADAYQFKAGRSSKGK